MKCTKQELREYLAVRNLESRVATVCFPPCCAYYYNGEIVARIFDDGDCYIDGDSPIREDLGAYIVKLKDTNKSFAKTINHMWECIRDTREHPLPCGEDFVKGWQMAMSVLCKEIANERVTGSDTGADEGWDNPGNGKGLNERSERG